MAERKTYKLSVLVTLEEPYLERLGEIERELSHAGLKVVGTSEFGGIIAGNVEEQKLGTLAQVRGVAAVEVDQNFTAEDKSDPK